MDMAWLKEFVDARIAAGHKVSAAAQNTVHSGVVVDHFGHVVNTATTPGGSQLVAQYTFRSGGTTIPDTFTATIIDFDTQDYDPSSLVTTGSSWHFTAATAGYYFVQAQVGVQVAVTNWPVAAEAHLHISSTGDDCDRLDQTAFTANTLQHFVMRGFKTVNMSAGGTLSVYVTLGNSNRNRDAFADVSRVAIWRV